MAVLSVTEIFEGRGSSTGQQDRDVRVFDVVTTDGSDDKYTILASGMVPVVGSAHSTQAHLTCKNVETRNKPGVRSPRHWLHRAEYDNQPFSPLPQLSSSIEPNPLKRPVVIDGYSMVLRRERTRGYLIGDYTEVEWNGGIGKTMPGNLSPMQTTAFEAFEGLEEDYPVWVINVKLNAPDIQEWVKPYQGAINDKEVVIRGYAKAFPRWSLMLKGFGHSEQLTEKLPNGLSIAYYETRFQLWFTRKLWVTPILNAGYFQLDNNGEKREILDRGARTRRKVILSKEGRVAGGTNQAALYRWYADGPEADYSVFKLSV